MPKSTLRAECSSRDAATLLGVSVSTIQQWVDSGELTAWKTVGGHRRISRESVDRMLNKTSGAGTTADDPVEQTQRERIRVLVVEDDADLLSLYEAMMTGWDLPLDIFTAENGFEGLVEVGRLQPDILLTDLNMPGLDGIRMIKTLCQDQQPAGMKIIVITGMDEADIRLHGGLPEQVDIMRKPAPFERLEKQITTICKDKLNAQ